MEDAQVAGRVPSDAEMWALVPFGEVAGLLALFHPRGEGHVRDRLVRCEQPTVSTTDGGTAVSMVCSHTRHGRFRFTFLDVEVMDADLVRRAPTDADVDKLRFYTFYVCDSANRVYGTPLSLSGRDMGGVTQIRQGGEERSKVLAAIEKDVVANPAVSLYASHLSFVGLSSIDWFASSFTVERVVASHTPGACAGCGSTEFYMSCLATFPVVADGQDGVRCDPQVADFSVLAEQVVFSKPFTKVVCRNCKLEKAAGPFGQFNGPVAGVAWDNTGSSNIRLSDMYNRQVSAGAQGAEQGRLWS